MKNEMKTGIVLLESINDAVRASDLSMLVNNNKPMLFDGMAVVIKYVRRGDMKDNYISLDSVVSEKIDFPILRDDLRKDVFDFFDAALTNFVNRALIAGTCDVSIQGDKEVCQTRVKISDYVEDRDELLNGLAKEDVRFDNICRNLTFPYVLNNDDIKEELDKLNIDEENSIPLVFITPLKVIKLDHVKLPNNRYLMSGNTMLLSEPDRVLKTSELNESTAGFETLVMTEDKNYLIGRTFNRKLSIRELECGELFEYKKRDYKI